MFHTTALRAHIRTSLADHLTTTRGLDHLSLLGFTWLGGYVIPPQLLFVQQIRDILEPNSMTPAVVYDRLAPGVLLEL